MTLTRRTVLASATAIVAPLLMAGQCAANLTPAQIVNDAENAVLALTNALKQVVANLPASAAPAVANIESYLADAATLLSALSTSAQATATAPTVQQIEGDLNAVISAAAAIPLIPPPFSTALAAASIVLPILEGFVNSIIPTAAASAATGAARAKMAALAPMSQADAEAALKRLAGR